MAVSIEVKADFAPLISQLKDLAREFEALGTYTLNSAKRLEEMDEEDLV